MSIKVLNPGLATSVQDLGRPGFYHLGIPLSGAMDRLALRVANLLVGNDEGAAALEISFLGPELRFGRAALVAVTGAELPPRLDGEPCPTWTSFRIEAGQILSFDYLKAGARAYLAVSGGIDVPPVLGSRSTYALGALGGMGGRCVQAGDDLPVCKTLQWPRPDRILPANLRPALAAPVELRMLPGLHWHRLGKDSAISVLADTWVVAPEADRIGYRFRGGRPMSFVEREPPFGAGSDPSNVVDCCYPYGSIQIPGGIEPIVLHRDAVSGGGYFMIGTVISADMDLIGQLQPNMPVRFVAVDMNAALEARKARQNTLEAIRRALA